MKLKIIQKKNFDYEIKDPCTLLFSINLVVLGSLFYKEGEGQGVQSLRMTSIKVSGIESYYNEM